MQKVIDNKKDKEKPIEGHCWMRCKDGYIMPSIFEKNGKWEICPFKSCSAHRQGGSND